MRKIAVAALMVSLAALVPVSSQAGDGEQHLSGIVRFPTRFTDGTSGFPGLSRRVYIVGGEPTNGSFGYWFDTPESTWCNEFTVTAVYDETHTANLDIFFYNYIGTIEDTESPITVGEFATMEPGGESGVVPPDSVKAIVFTPDGVNASFLYDSVASGTTDC